MQESINCNWKVVESNKGLRLRRDPSASRWTDLKGRPSLELGKPSLSATVKES